MTNANLPAVLDYCNNLAAGSMIPRQFQGNPANVLYAVEYADALDIPRINAITSIHVIDGKPSASADLIAGLVRKAGHKLRVKVERTPTGPVATAQIIRCDDPDYTFETRWDIARATAAGLAGKGNWNKYPEAMLKARAITEVAREGASDALMGVIYTPEELGETVDQDGAPVSSGPRRTTSQQVASERVQAQGSTSAAVSAAIGGQAQAPTLRTLTDAEFDKAIGKVAEATTEEELKSLWGATAELVEDQCAALKAAITSALKTMREAAQAPAADQAPTVDEAVEVIAEVMGEEVAAA